MFACAQCGKTISVAERVSRSALCPHCGAYLHSCVNCRFYSTGSHNDCREPQAEYVSNKRGSNFCEFFTPSETEENADNQGSKKITRERFDNLFNT
ncbi:MAG: hypothetical protein AMS17_02870 [Spirochaetes bacterium DG_61]|nr:MAG: hypothetical protein AMS17_02870 [Spirochaetes bacterium DG_61]